jgi:hypothetical protein
MDMSLDSYAPFAGSRAGRLGLAAVMLALGGCSPLESPQVSVEDWEGPGLDVEWESGLGAVDAPPPLVVQPFVAYAGEEVDIVVSGPLGEGERVYLPWSMVGEGEGPCFRFLGGACMGLVSPSLGGSGLADAFGTAVITVVMPETLGAELSVEAWVLRGRLGDSSIGSTPVTELITERPRGAPGDCTLSGSFTPVASLAGPAPDPNAMTVAWDGTHYHGANGGWATNPMHRFDEAGSLVSTHEIASNIRAVFTKDPGAGPTYVKEAGLRTLLVETGPGTYVPDVTLTDGVLAPNNTVTYDWWNRRFITLNAGSVEMWDDEGAYAGNIELPGWWGNRETVLFSDNGCYLTMNDGTLTVDSWDFDGTHKGTATLSLADSYSFSYANGLVWKFDHVAWAWMGFDLGI